MELSVLNVVPIRQGQTTKDAFDQMTKLAQAVEKLGYTRYWVAEHHNTKLFASSATVLLIQQILANTEKIRVGAGGIMLPNHSPYIVAEQFGTLETLYPERVDLGLGRAPGTDLNTAMAIRRTSDLQTNFEEEILELQGYFKDSWNVHAYPAAGLDVPFYILGSSTDSAFLAAELGLPYAFASHFAPAQLEKAVAIYQANFKPSQYLAYPYVIIGANVIAADTDEEAKHLETSMLQGFIDIITGSRDYLKPPVDSEEKIWNQLTSRIDAAPHFGPVAFQKEQLIRDAKAALKQMLDLTLCGGPETLAKQYKELKERVQFDEIMVNTFIYDPKAQIHSFEIFKNVVDQAEKAE